MNVGDSSRRGERYGRRRLLQAIGTAGVAAQAGCGRLSPWGKASQSDEITIEYVEVAGARAKETFDPVVEALEERHGRPIKLSFDEVPYENIKSNLQTRVGGGNPPDVAAIDQIWLGSFVDGGALLDIDAVADETDLDDYLDPFVDVARPDGTLYAVPITTDVRGMYWNRSAFEDVGLDPDEPPETWPALLDAAEQLHDPPKRYGATYFVVGGRWTVNLFAGGGRVLSDDGTEPRFHEEPGVRAAELVDDLYNGRAVGPPEPPYRDGAAMAREFLRGDYGMTVVEGSWLDYFWRNMGNENGAMVDQFGFAPTPHPGGGQRATMSGGHMWAGFADTDNPEIVRDFIGIAAGREFKRHLAIKTGDIPTRESLQDDEEVWSNMLYGEAKRDLLADTHLRPIRNWPIVAEELDPALQAVAFDEQDPRPALEEAAEAVRSELG